MTNWSGGAQGALGGAGIGFGIGGPIGDLVGAGLGGLAGLFGGDGGAQESEDNKQRMLAFYNSLGSPQHADYSEFRQNQKNYINALEAQASGRGPSLAQAQMEAATNRSAKQSQGLALSGAGNPAAAAMMAQGASAQMGMQNTQDAGAARIQEQLNAQQLLGINLHGARGADEGMNQFNASQGGYNNQLRLQALMGIGGQNQRTPMMGEQILAGGAGAFGQYAAQQMNKPKAPPSNAIGAPGTGYQTWQNPNAGPRY